MIFQLASDIGSVLEFTFPHGHNLPAIGTQQLAIFLVSPDIPLELVLPKFPSCFGHSEPPTFCTHMPEASIDKDNNTLRQVDNVWSTWELTSMKTIPGVANITKNSTNMYLGLRVLRLHALH